MTNEQKNKIKENLSEDINVIIALEHKYMKYSLELGKEAIKLGDILKSLNKVKHACLTTEKEI